MASSNQDNQGNPGKQNQGGGSQDDHQGDDRGSRNQSALLHDLTAGEMSHRYKSLFLRRKLEEKENRKTGLRE